MALKILEIHHHAIRVPATGGTLDKALAFYRDTLGLAPDRGRPDIPGIPGIWFNVAAQSQIHVLAVDGASPLAKSPEEDPTADHLALAVPDIQEAKRELERMKVPFWSLGGAANLQDEAVFIKDPFGKTIELHQAGRCRCKR